jgi:hypothetical protein
MFVWNITRANLSEGYTQVIDQSALGFIQKVVHLKLMPGITIQNGWHICNQNI